jgi:hypothetical protein
MEKEGDEEVKTEVQGTELKSDRDREKQRANVKIDVEQLRRNATAAKSAKPIDSLSQQKVETKEEIREDAKEIPAAPTKNFACEKCKVCDEY